MKALFINGSPRKNWITFKMLDSAMKGAAEAGAETEIIHEHEFHCKGEFKGIHKGKPDAADLAAAAEFAKSIVSC